LLKNLFITGLLDSRSISSGNEGFLLLAFGFSLWQDLRVQTLSRLGDEAKYPGKNFLKISWKARIMWVFLIIGSRIVRLRNDVSNYQQVVI
jgi:hypothetical protein